MITQLLDEARRIEAARDPFRASVSDLYGCDRATWYRRNGYEFPRHSAATLRKFDLGHAVEARIAFRLAEAGEGVLSGTRVALWVDEGTGELYGEPLDEDDVAGSEMVTGHPDLYLTHRGAVVEVKTTDVRRPETTCKPHYALQAAAYAFGLGVNECWVHITYVVTWDKEEREHLIDVGAWRGRIAQRVREVLANTAPGSEMPEAQPPVESAEWACKYCVVGQCERNQNEKAGFLEVADPCASWT